MTSQRVNTLHEFIALNRQDIIDRCRRKVAARSLPPPTNAEIEHGVPLFLDQVVDALSRGLLSSPAISTSAILHGHELLLRGFSVSQVVHDYGDVCQSITELAIELGAPISADDFRMLNGCLDDAIAGAVTQYGRERDQSTIDGGIVRENQRLGFFAHELRNLIHTALMAFEVVHTGNVGVSGSTGAVLHRSLIGARDLIAGSLAEVRLTQGVQHPEPFLVSALIEDAAAAAQLAAEARGISLRLVGTSDGVLIHADPQVLRAVMMNLLQNAIKFTRPATVVTLRLRTTADRVLLDVQDECEGLPDCGTEELFKAFEQRGADRSGLGLGLAFSRWAAEANHGRIHVQNLPGVGCVFTLDLPRLVTPATVGS